MRNGNEAIAWAKNEISHPSQDWYRYCLMFVRMSFGLPGGYPTAYAAWQGAKKKHKTSNAHAIPRGVPVFFYKASSPSGHIVLSLGGGLCISTDIARHGKPDICKIEDIVTKWGMPLLGWTEDLQDQQVYTPAPNAKPTPHITAALKARTNDKRVAALQQVQEHGSKPAQANATTWIEAINEQTAAQKKAAAAAAALTKLERH